MKSNHASGRREHSAWWPLKWLSLIMVSAIVLATLRHPERAHGEWELLPPMILCPMLFTLAARDVVILTSRRESAFEWWWRAASAVIATTTLGVLLWQVLVASY